MFPISLENFHEPSDQKKKKNWFQRCQFERHKQISFCTNCVSHSEKNKLKKLIFNTNKIISGSNRALFWQRKNMKLLGQVERILQRASHVLFGDILREGEQTTGKERWCWRIDQVEVRIQERHFWSWSGLDQGHYYVSVSSFRGWKHAKSDFQIVCVGPTNSLVPGIGHFCISFSLLVIDVLLIWVQCWSNKLGGRLRWFGQAVY